MIIRLGIKIHNSSKIGYSALNIFRITTEIKLLHDKRASFKCDDFEKVSIRLVLFIFFLVLWKGDTMLQSFWATENILILMPAYYFVITSCM